MKLAVNGHEAYAYTGGRRFDPALPCVVFLHGALHDHSVWTLLARWFAHHGRAVLAVDCPGHGRSGGPPLASVEALADWSLALLDAAGVRQAAFVGHSSGSLVALEAAARAADRVTRLVLVAIAHPMKVAPALLALGRDTPLDAIDLMNVHSHSTIGAKPAYPGPGSWLHGGNRALMRRMLAAQAGQAEQERTNLFVHDFSLCDRYVNGLQAATQVTCPVTVLLGERDQMNAPRNARELASALNARVVMLPGGHALMQEVPDAVLRELRIALR
jgi:pimeloyl-ACP methyl ester carboxylesterase